MGEIETGGLFVHHFWHRIDRELVENEILTCLCHRMALKKDISLFCQTQWGTPTLKQLFSEENFMKNQFSQEGDSIK